jgi:hypothetical protein
VKAMLTVFEVVVGLVVERCGWWSGCMWIAEMRTSDSSGQAAFMYATSSTHATQELNAAAP